MFIYFKDLVIGTITVVNKLQSCEQHDDVLEGLIFE